MSRLLVRPAEAERERSLDRRLSFDPDLSFLSLDFFLSSERGRSSILWYSSPLAAEIKDLLREREPDRDLDTRCLELDLSERDVTLESPDSTFFRRRLPLRHLYTQTASTMEIAAAISFISNEIPSELALLTAEEEDDVVEEDALLLEVLEENEDEDDCLPLLYKSSSYQPACFI